MSCSYILKDPVLLSCRHCLCKACLQNCLAKKDPCDALLERDQRASEVLFSLHIDKLKPFCLNHQQPVCVVCRDSKNTFNTDSDLLMKLQKNHRKKKLKHILKPIQEKLNLLCQAKRNCDPTEEHIKVQGRHTERQVKDVLKKLHQFLQEEEKARISALWRRVQC